VSAFPLLVIVHALAATVWTGGHLVLDLGVLPRALRERSAAAIRGFEETFEPLGLTALAIQVITGLWMGWIYLPGFRGPGGSPPCRCRGVEGQQPGEEAQGEGGGDQQPRGALMLHDQIGEIAAEISATAVSRNNPVVVTKAVPSSQWRERQEMPWHSPPPPHWLRLHPPTPR